MSEIRNKTIDLTRVLNNKSIYAKLIQYIDTVAFLSTHTSIDKISAPVLYLVRHSIEIGLKSAIMYLCEKSDSNSMCREKKLDGHELARLYNCFNQHWQDINKKYDFKKQGGQLEQIIIETEKYHKELKELIEFYDECDQNSTLFRYGNKSSIKIKQKYSFLMSEYCDTVMLIDMDRFIEKYQNSILVFKFLEDALSDFFEYYVQVKKF